jgi:hypothetical protein
LSEEQKKGKANKPRQPHGPNEPKMLLKVMQTNLEWFNKYLGPHDSSQASEN